MRRRLFPVLALLALLAGCRVAGPPAPPVTPGAYRMRPAWGNFALTGGMQADGVDEEAIRRELNQLLLRGRGRVVWVIRQGVYEDGSGRAIPFQGSLFSDPDLIGVEERSESALDAGSIASANGVEIAHDGIRVILTDADRYSIDSAGRAERWRYTLLPQ